MADIHLVLQKGKATDLVMPSKLTNILSVGGTAIISACLNSTLFEIISSNGIGFPIEPENSHALVEAIQSVLLNDDGKISTNARVYAENFLSIDKIMCRYLTQLHDIDTHQAA
jgi:colanic acid biosynthesis glycosyl transferase WcaI